MKKLTIRITMVLSIFCLLLACQKELSTENGGFAGTAQGTLTDSLGNCKSITINGNYAVDSTLGDNNYLLVNVNFTTQGKYYILSDTVNGIWFLDSGYVLNTGQALVKIRGKGKPLLAKSVDFTLSFNGNVCGFSVVTTTGSGSPGNGGGGGGTGTGNGTDYFPTTAGSTWTYRYTPKLSTIDTFKVIVAPLQVKVDSLSYAQFATSLGDTFYFAKNNSIGNYYALSTVDFDYTNLFDSLPNLYITYPFLKESANVNDSWETQEYGTVKLSTSATTAEYGKTKAVFTIVSKNTVPYTVGGVTYQNVINVKREIKFQPNSGTYRSLSIGNSYYAKGYGLIDQVIGTSPNQQAVSTIRGPTIK